MLLIMLVSLWMLYEIGDITASAATAHRAVVALEKTFRRRFVVQQSAVYYGNFFKRNSDQISRILNGPPQRFEGICIDGRRVVYPALVEKSGPLRMICTLSENDIGKVGHLALVIKRGEADRYEVEDVHIELL